MLSRISLLIFALVSLQVLAGATAVAQTKPAPATRPSNLFRFVRVETEQGNGGSISTLYYEPPGQKFGMLQMGMYRTPLADHSGANHGPSDTKLAEISSSLKRGELIDLKFSDDDAVTAITKYDPRPGEEMPDYAEFVRVTSVRYKENDFPGIVVSRYGKEREYPIGELRDKNWVADPKLAEAALALRAGDAVEVEVSEEEPGVFHPGAKSVYFLRKIAAFGAPLPGVVVAVREVPPAEDAECYTTKDRTIFSTKAGKDAQSISLAVDIKIDGSADTKSFVALGYTVLSTVAAIKEGQQIYLKTRQYGGKEVLVGVQLRER